MADALSWAWVLDRMPTHPVSQSERLENQQNSHRVSCSSCLFFLSFPLFFFLLLYWFSLSFSYFFLPPSICLACSFPAGNGRIDSGEETAWLIGSTLSQQLSNLPLATALGNQHWKSGHAKICSATSPAHPPSWKSPSHAGKPVLQLAVHPHPVLPSRLKRPRRISAPIAKSLSELGLLHVTGTTQQHCTLPAQVGMPAPNRPISAGDDASGERHRGARMGRRAESARPRAPNRVRGCPGLVRRSGVCTYAG